MIVLFILMRPNKIKSKSKFWKAFLIQRFKKASDNQLDFQQILDYKVQTTHFLTPKKKKKKIKIKRLMQCIWTHVEILNVNFLLPNFYQNRDCSCEVWSRLKKKKESIISWYVHGSPIKFWSTKQFNSFYFLFFYYYFFMLT